MVQPSPSRKSIDVLILCALKDEFDQLLKVETGLSAEGWTQSKSSSGRFVADAILSTADNQTLSIRATWAAHMGREQCQAVLAELTLENQFKCLAMTGICAGRRGKTELGDVIFADRLWSYDAGKSVIDRTGTEVFQGDMVQYRPPETWVQHMQTISVPDTTDWLSGRPLLSLEHQENWILQCLLSNEEPTNHPKFDYSCPDWADVLKRLWEREWVSRPLELTAKGKLHIEELLLLNPKGLPSPKQFNIHVAPIATGAVVKEDPKIFDKLSGSMRKTLGLDMEASGLAASAEALGIPVIVAKAVSDFGDTYKDDRYREFGARASAETLMMLLRSSADLLLPAIQNSLQQQPAIPFPQRELIDQLAELFPSISETRAIWERAGGYASDVDSIAKPRDLWQLLWKKTMQGAAVNPVALLSAILEEFPGNTVIKSHFEALTKSQ